MEDNNVKTNFNEGARIKVIGVGGAGNNAINRIIEAGVRGVETIALNTDRQALNNSNAVKKIQIGEKLTRGLGAGANPDVGRCSAQETKDVISEALNNSEMVVITAGMGGGLVDKVKVIVAEIAKEEKYTYIFESNGALWYAEESEDITSKLVKKLNLK